MHHYIAFLRGINLGRRRPPMAGLRALFVKMRFTGVATFIASGNVIFASKVADRRKIEQTIEAGLQQALGYGVDTFVRTRAELAAVAAFQPFARDDLDNPAHTVYATFLKEALTAGQARQLLACRTGVDDFCVAGREFYWLCRIKSNDSNVWASPQMKAVRLPTTTMRNLTTVRKLAALYPAPTL
jgi:uncharacterized protein (DUF1697 family)